MFAPLAKSTRVDPMRNLPRLRLMVQKAEGPDLLRAGERQGKDPMASAADPLCLEGLPCHPTQSSRQGDALHFEKSDIMNLVR